MAKKNTNFATSDNEDESLGCDTEQNQPEMQDIYSIISFIKILKMVKKKYFYEKQRVLAAFGNHWLGGQEECF